MENKCRIRDIRTQPSHSEIEAVAADTGMDFLTARRHLIGREMARMIMQERRQRAISDGLAAMRVS